MYTYTYIHTHRLLCHFSNMALTGFCGTFKGKRSQNYMNPFIFTWFSSYHHPTAKTGKEKLFWCSLHSESVAEMDVWRWQLDQVSVRNLYSILELCKKWLNLWICHNIPFYHHTEMKLSLSFWVCEYILSSVNQSWLHHRESLVDHRGNNLWKESRAGWMILIYNYIIE